MENTSTHDFGAAGNTIVAGTIEFIKKAHDGQLYGDSPYWTHPVAVANTIENPTLTEYLGALLHDTVEDTKYTFDDLAEVFDRDVLRIVYDCTKQPGTYEENIQRIIDTGNASSMKVKLADNRVNFGGDKSDMPAKRRDRLTAQYTMSMDMLTTALKDN